MVLLKSHKREVIRIVVILKENKLFAESWIWHLFSKDATDTGIIRTSFLGHTSTETRFQASKHYWHKKKTKHGSQQPAHT